MAVKHVTASLFQEQATYSVAVCLVFLQELNFLSFFMQIYISTIYVCTQEDMSMCPDRNLQRIIRCLLRDINA